MKVEKKKKFEKKYLVLTLFIISFAISLSLVCAVTTTTPTFGATSSSSSTSVFNVQYSNQFGGNYEQYLHFPSSTVKESEEFIDMEVMIPPAGCQPYVVRSDLLEEQNVPVFCQLVALKINPGVDITNIDRIDFKQKGGDNPYISSVGFHPANAAIRSLTSLTSSPVSSNLGYVVVVLKQQESERTMPDFVNMTLSAVLNYGGEHTFGIGQTEFYVPVMTDSEFENSMKDYSFFNGIGYVRAERVDDDSATISIYSSENRIIYSGTLQKGKTSGNINLPTSTGGKQLKVTLKDLTIPQVKAKFIVNGEETSEVYKGGKFYNDKCMLNGVQANGGGTGKVSVRCGSTSFTLEKKFNQVEFLINGQPQVLSIGDKIPNTQNLNYYFVKIGIMPDSGKSYVILADASGLNPNAEQITAIAKNLDKSLANLKQTELTNQLDALQDKGIPYSNDAINLYVVYEGGDKNKLEDIGLEYTGVTSSDKIIEENILSYFKKSVGSYEDIASKFGSEDNLQTKRTYGEESLWAEYYLAKDLGQNQKRLEALSALINDYPESKNTEGKTASQLFSEGNLMSNEGSSQYLSKEGISIELVSINEPLKTEANVELTYRVGDGESTPFSAGFNDTIYYQDGVRVSLDSFDERQAYISYSCPASSMNNNRVTSVRSKSVALGQTLYFEGCDGRVTINNINLQKVANIILVPKTSGISKETNFTFTIGIEKRPELFNLTPDEANSQLKELNKQIADFKNITEGLGKLIKAGKITCLATSAALNIKNLLSGMSGTSTARPKVMQYWNNLCAKEADPEACIARNADPIEKSVTDMTTSLQKYNDYQKGLEAKSKDGTNIDNTKLTNNTILALQDPDGEQASLWNNLKVIDNNGKEVDSIDGKNISNIIKDIDMQNIYQSDLKELITNLYVVDNTQVSELKNASKIKIYNILKQVKEQQDISSTSKSTSAEYGISVPTLMDEKVKTVDQQVYSWSTLSDRFSGSNITMDPGQKVVMYNYAPKGQNSKTYLAKLKTSGSGVYSVLELYEVNGNTLTQSPDSSAKSFVFRDYDAASLKNYCKNCNTLRVYNMEPYKGMIQQMPFNEQEGWYVETQNLMPFSGNQKTYFDSGAINSFTICNVGKNGMLEGMNANDDKPCMGFSLNTGMPLNNFPGLDETQSKKLVNEAISAIKTAQSLLTTNPSSIKINGMNLKVEGSSGSSGGTKCTDYMSVKDCQIMFNVCDPFVCPSSRCDLGGTYKVENVIQSGIIGSFALCLPNFIAFRPDDGVIIPVCITGINAGLEGWISILEQYRDCINESVATGKQVGICDEIHSIYVCDFFWKQIGPFVSSIAKNLFSAVMLGQGTRGGGEYMFVNDAWNNAEKSWQYFTSSYASNSKLAFGARSITELGSEVCKMQASATYPDRFGEMLEPESPVQINAWFDEMTYTSASVPPTSQYKVFYHIFSGNDQGHYYQVYLKDAPTSIGYAGRGSITIDSGYIGQGETVSITKDFLDVAGYKQLCVMIDTQENCGFKSVSTGFALNYAKDQLVSQQATEQISSEKDCISGTASFGSLLTPNIQQGAEEAIAPEIYNYGVIRVCATDNPGKSVDASRWTPVGNCGSSKIQCWIDEYSVKNAIKGRGIENQTIEEINEMDLNAMISKGYLNSSQADAQIKAFDDFYNNFKTDQSSITSEQQTYLDSLEMNVKSVYDILIYNRDKARLLFKKAQIYDNAARILNKKNVIAVATATTIIPDENSEISTESVIQYSVSADNKIISIIKGSKMIKIYISGNILKLGDVNDIGTYSNNRITIVESKLSLDVINDNDDKIMIMSINGKSLTELSAASSSIIGATTLCTTEDSCLRCMAYAEAGGSTSSGKIPDVCTQYIMGTIKNRVNTDFRPASTSVCQAVSLENQYEAYDCVNNANAANQKYCDCCKNPEIYFSQNNVPIEDTILTDSIVNSQSMTHINSFRNYGFTEAMGCGKILTTNPCYYVDSSDKVTTNPIFDFYEC